jgi:hypothetical protein
VECTDNFPDFGPYRIAPGLALLPLILLVPQSDPGAIQESWC